MDMDWCDRCDGPRRIMQTSNEAVITGPYEETEFFVIALECGHDITLPIRKHYFE